MFSKHDLVGGAAAVVAMAVLAACSASKDINVETPVDPMFKSYASLGNSITAGYESGGINDSTQKDSYAYQFAQDVGTRFALPYLAMPGCAPPVNNFQTQSRVGGGTASTCALRTPTSVTYAINNVAVPGAAAIDPISLTSANSNALTTFILGGATQVQRAAQVLPTFVSMWIGNNDALPAALSGVLVPVPGVSPGLTPVNTFISRYKSDMTAMLGVSGIQGGVLFGVVDVTNAPLMFHSNLLFTPYKAAFDAAAQTVTTIDASCANATALIDFQYTSAIHAGLLPSHVMCKDSATATYPLLGNLYVLDSAEVPIVQATVAQYNAYIKAKADSIGWAYVDVNPTLLALKAAGAIPIFPVITSPDTTFGQYFTLDGVHPSRLAHTAIANLMIDSVNAKYGTSVPSIP